MKKYWLSTLFLTTVFSAAPLFAVPAEEQKSSEHESYIWNIAAEDMPGDSGDIAVVSWKVPTEAPADLTYQVFASLTPDDASSWKKVIEFSAEDKTLTGNNVKLPIWVWKKGKDDFAVQVQLENIFGEKGKDINVYCKVKAVENGKTVEESPELTAFVKSNWFRADRINTLAVTLLIIAVFLYALSRAKVGKFFIRRINGLDAIEEAVGRATEMGKPIFYTTGLYDIESISTIASVFILGEVAKKVAAYDCGLIVPHKQFLTMSVCKAVTKEAYIEVGRPDSYREDSNFFLNPDQFAYATGVEAIITREKPAACFFMGSFAAEALLMSEVGTTVGAIQVAGTDSEDQLPFFFTSCDYTLIGEELYAAGAYLSKDPLLVSALKVQDFGKLLFIVVTVICVAITLYTAGTNSETLQKFTLNLLTGY